MSETPATAAVPIPTVRSPGPENPKGWLGNDRNTLLVVATLITTLTYTVGTNPPGGCWQDDGPDHFAGNPIMRDRHRRRYWLFMAASLVGFGNSMLLTLWLLIGMGPDSHLVRLSFTVSYSSLLLTFISSIPGTSLAMDVGIWAGLMGLLWATTYVLELELLGLWKFRA